MGFSKPPNLPKKEKRKKKIFVVEARIKYG